MTCGTRLSVQSDILEVFTRYSTAPMCRPPKLGSRTAGLLTAGMDLR